MTESGLRHACWTRPNADAVLKTEALEGNDALFMATHTPVHGFKVSGTRGQDVSAANEGALLEALSDPTRRHAFCVVQGEPGSGKSHLIRWLFVNWPVETDVTLLLQRADGSLVGALNQLQNKLTKIDPEFSKLFDGIGQRHNARISGRAAVFRATLAAMLKADYFEQPPDDAEWCEKHDLEALISNVQVKNRWQSPTRILEMIDGKAEQRNSERASFNIEDIYELGRICIDVNEKGPAQSFANRLLEEATEMEEARGEGQSWEDVRAKLVNELPATLGLMNALNRRRNDAVQNVIGVTAAALKRIFERARAEMGNRGQRLVLLLEDITSWEGLDDSLIDALVLNSETRPDRNLAPIVSVVGVTPEYFADLAGNYQQRITHNVQLGQADGAYQDAAATRDAIDRNSFVARYLNAARVGTAALDVWRDAQRRQRDISMPNHCMPCEFRVNCHEIFGEIDGVGLFPFTTHAIDRFFLALKSDDRGQTHRTPRGLLQSVIGPTLRNPAMLGAGRYPGAEVETDTFHEQELLISGPLRRIIDIRVNDPEVRERVRRTIVFWGDKTRPNVGRLTSGIPTFAETPWPVFTAFGLPWLGDTPTTGASEVPLASPPTDPTLPLVGDGYSPMPKPPKPPGRTPVGAPGRPDRSGTAAPARTTKTDLEKLKIHIAEARSGAPIREAATWNTLLYDMVSKLDSRALRFDRYVWNSLFTSNTVMIEGSGQARNYSFVVPRLDWVYDGLEAFVSLRSEELGDGDHEYHRRRLAFMLRQLGPLAEAHALKRLPPLASGARWDMIASATQVLLARAWLRGAVLPSATTAQQWLVLLSDEGLSSTDPQSRTEPWQSALRNTDQQHDKIRSMLREMIALPQGTSSDFGLADAGAAGRALVSLRDTLSFSAFSMAAGSTALFDDDGLRLTTAKLAEFLERIPPLEFKLLKERATEFDGLLHGQSIRARADRIDRGIRLTFQSIKELSPDKERRWRESWERLVPLLDHTLDLRATERLVSILAADEVPQLNGQSALLDWLAVQPAGNLKALLDLLKSGESLVRDLIGPVRSYVEAGNQVDLSAVHAAGNDLAGASATARKNVLDPHS